MKKQRRRLKQYKATKHNVRAQRYIANPPPYSGDRAWRLQGDFGLVEKGNLAADLVLWSAGPFLPSSRLHHQGRLDRRRPHGRDPNASIRPRQPDAITVPSGPAFGRAPPAAPRARFVFNSN